METHVVKKYSNRKLYDTHTKKYVTLDVIAELLRRGDEVRVVDRTSGEDITAVTLSQILLDMERHRRSAIPEPVLVDMVKERGEQVIQLLRSSFQLPRETLRRAAGGIENSAQTIGNRADDVVTSGLRNLGIASYEELEELRAELERLKERVAGLTSELEERGPRHRSGHP